MADTALQRKNMVESQVRPSDVTDRRIMTAMQELPRERFVPEAMAALAYMDEMLILGDGRAMTAPRTLARLVQLAGIEAGQKVLVVGALTGYSAALISSFGAKVTALESNPAFAEAARTALGIAGSTDVKVVTGDLAKGHKAGGPYDVIFIDGSIERLPDALMEQLAAGGRLIAVERGGDRVGRAVTYRKSAGNAVRRAAFDASAALLPGFETPAGFKF